MSWPAHKKLLGNAQCAASFLVTGSSHTGKDVLPLHRLDWRHLWVENDRECYFLKAERRLQFAVVRTCFSKLDTSFNVSTLNKVLGWLAPAWMIFHLLPGSWTTCSKKRSRPAWLDLKPSDKRSATCLQVSTGLWAVITFFSCSLSPPASSHCLRDTAPTPFNTQAKRNFRSMGDLDKAQW